MSKRLEELKEKYSKANVIEHMNGIDIIAVDIEDIDELIKTSVEKAERVQELEKEKEQDPRQGMLEDLHAENKRYRTLLKEVNAVILEAIEALNKGEKVNGLGFMYNSINQQLEEIEGGPHESS